jgi:hypothetical protein
VSGRLKQIRYRNFVDFNLPVHWQEDYSDPDQAAFFEEDDWPGTLRVSLMELVPPDDIDVAGVAELVRGMTKDPSAELISDSNQAIAHHAATVTEAGTSLCLLRWLVAKIVNPRFVRLAIFTLTERTKDLGTIRANAEIALVEGAVRQAVVSTASIKLL